MTRFTVSAVATAFVILLFAGGFAAGAVWQNHDQPATRTVTVTTPDGGGWG